MAKFMTEKCKACKAPLIWVSTPKGAMMPVDSEPHNEGNVLVLSPQDGRLPIGHVIADHLIESVRAAAPEFMHRSHFATCPQADTFRKKS